MAITLTLSSEKIDNLSYNIKYNAITTASAHIVRVTCSNGYDISFVQGSNIVGHITVNINKIYTVTAYDSNGDSIVKTIRISGITPDPIPTAPTIDFTPKYGSAFYPIIEFFTAEFITNYNSLYPNSSGFMRHEYRVLVNGINLYESFEIIMPDGTVVKGWNYTFNGNVGINTTSIVDDGVILDDGIIEIQVRAVTNQEVIGKVASYTFRYYKKAYDETLVIVEKVEAMIQNFESSKKSEIKVLITQGLAKINSVPNYTLSSDFLSLKDRLSKMQELIDSDFQEPDVALPVSLKLNTVFVIDKSVNMSTDNRMTLLNSGMSKMIRRLQDMQSNYKITITTRFIFFGPSSIQSSSQLNIDNITWTDLNPDGTPLLAPAVSDMMTKVLDIAHFPSKKDNNNLTPLFILYSSGNIDDEEEYNKLIHQFDDTYWGKNSKRIAIGVTNSYKPVLDTWENGSNLGAGFDPNSPDDGLNNIIPPIIVPSIPSTNTAVIGSMIAQGLEDSLVENTEDFFIRTFGLNGDFKSDDKLQYKIQFGSRAAGKIIKVKRKDGYLMSVTLDNDGAATFNPMNTNSYFLFKNYPELTTYDGIYNQVIIDFDKGKYSCNLTLMRYSETYKRYMATSIKSRKDFIVFGPPTPKYIMPINHQDFIRVPTNQTFSIDTTDTSRADKIIETQLYIDDKLVQTKTTDNSYYPNTSSFNINLRSYSLGKHTWYCIVSNGNYSVRMPTMEFTISLAESVLAVTGRDRFQISTYEDITTLDSNIVCTGIYDFNVNVKYATYFSISVNDVNIVEETQDFNDSWQDNKYLNRSWTNAFDIPGTYNITIKYNKGNILYTKAYKLIINDYPVSLNSTVTYLDRYNIPSLDPRYAQYNIVSLDDIKAVTTATMKSGEVKPFTYFATGEISISESYFEKIDNDNYHALKVGTTSVTLKLIQANRTISTYVTVRTLRYAVSLYCVSSKLSMNKYVWTPTTISVKYSDNSTITVDYTKLTLNTPDFVESQIDNGLKFRSLKNSDGIIGLAYGSDDKLVKFPELFDNKLNMNFTTNDSNMSIYSTSYNMFDATSISKTYTEGDLNVFAISCDGEHRITIACRYADYLKITKNNITVKERTFDVDNDLVNEYRNSSYTDTVNELGHFVYRIEMTKNTGETLSYDISLTVTDYIISMQQGQIYNVSWRTGEVTDAGINVNSSLPNEIFHVDAINTPTVQAREFNNLIIKMRSGATYNYDQYMNAIGTHFNYSYSDSAIKFTNSIVNFTSYDIPPSTYLYKTLTITYNRQNKNLHYTAAFIFTPNVIFAMTGKKKFDESSYSEIAEPFIAYRGIYSFKAQWNYANMTKIYVNDEVVYDITQDFSNTSNDSSFTKRDWTNEFDTPGTYNIVLYYTSKTGNSYTKSLTITIFDYPVAISSNVNKPIVRYPIPQSKVGYEEYNTVSFEGYISVTMKSGLVVDFNNISGFGTTTQNVNSSYLSKLDEGNYACIRHGQTTVTYTIRKPNYTLQATITVNINRYAVELKMYMSSEIYIDKYQWSRARVKVLWSDSTTTYIDDNTILSIRADNHIRYRINNTGTIMEVTAIVALPGMVEFIHPIGTAPYFDGLFNNKVEAFVFVSDTDSKLTVTGLKTFDSLTYEDISDNTMEISYDGTYKLKIKTQYADSVIIKKDGVVVYQYDYDLDTDSINNYLSKEVIYTLDQITSNQFDISLIKNTGIIEGPSSINKSLNINITDYPISLQDGYIQTSGSITINGITYPSITKKINEYLISTVSQQIDITELLKLVIRMKSGRVYDYLEYMASIGTHLTESNSNEVLFYNNKFLTFNNVPTVNYAEFNYLRPYYKLDCYRVAFLGTTNGTHALQLFQSDNFEIDRITFIWDCNIDEIQIPDITQTACVHISNEIIDETLNVEFINGKHTVDTLIPGNKFIATLSLKYIWTKPDGTKNELVITSNTIEPITKPIDFGHNVTTITPYEENGSPTFLFLVDWAYPTAVINKDISFYNVSIYDKIPIEVVWDYTDKPTAPIETPDDDISDNDTLVPIGVKQYKVGDKEYSIDDSSYLLNPFDPSSVLEYRWITVKSLIEYDINNVVTEQ